MAAPRYLSFDTLSLHAGQQPDPTTGARATPIYQTTSFVFRDTDHAAALFNMERAGHVYSRISNPTNAVLEERIAALEGGIGAIATASGQAALHLAVATIAAAGSHIVSSRSLYGGSHNLLQYTLKRFGIETTFVDPRNLEAWRSAIRPNTRLLFGETLGNPGLDVLDVPAVAQIAHDAKLPLLLDSTFTTPYLMRPFELGADLLYHSATKFLGGHGIAIGGLLVDGGTFDWEAVRQIPRADRALRGLPRHGLPGGVHRSPLSCCARAAKACAISARAWRRPPPSISCRASRRSACAWRGTSRTRARWSSSWPLIRRSSRSATRSCLRTPTTSWPRQLLPRGAGAVFTFSVKGGRPAGRKFIESLRVFSHLANVGDAKSLVIHPATTTHFRMDDAALAAAGIGPGTIRLSIGLEDAQDLIDDLAGALRASQKS